MADVSHPDAERLHDVLRFVFGHLPDSELAVRVDAVIAQFGLGTITLTDVFQATDGDRLIGALFSQARPDGSILLWPPRGVDDATEKSLFDAFGNRCAKKRTKLAVMLADLQQSVDIAKMKRQGGFEYVSELVYLVCQPTDAETNTDERITFVPMRHENESDFPRMVDLVRETYRNTLDFPQLVGITPTDDVLEGYKLGAVFRPELWFFVQQDGKDVGSLLLTDQSDEQMELTYMGIVEEHRGFGFGNSMVAFAKQTAAVWKRPFLLTSVDEQNTAAVRAYLGRGFVAWDRKKVLARFFNATLD